MLQSSSLYFSREKNTPYNEARNASDKENPMTETQTETSVPTTSRKREVTATVAATVVVTVLTIAAGHFFDKVGKKVHNQIAPPPEQTQ
jgi:hypothetical protein